MRNGDVLDGCGAGARWSEATRRTNLKHYAGWLGWLQATGGLDWAVAPADRVTPSRVRAYVRDLGRAVAPITVSSYLRDLKVVTKAMSPDRDCRWLMDMTCRLKSWAQPVRIRRPQGLPAHDMFRTALEELARLTENGFRSPRATLAYRDTLLVAMLICAPLRLRNLAMIRVGEQLEKQGDEWHLRFAGHETKTHQPLHLVLPDALECHVETYMRHVRPAFPGAELTDRLWISAKRAPMAETTIYARVMRTSERLFGTAVNPHTFRTIAATFLAESSPEDALRARPLLGHRRNDTTEAHYIMADQIRASQKVADALLAIRDGPLKHSGNSDPPG
ncbi:Phage integrase family protein [Cribrihabitans marinus]|uniref:Phage integrase family protein n=2 Tax=Cribrihabitans marinus TaxID=1227549 RepID=A0A1H7E1D0_9RHOB|nr:Phage integrase family protein [Cribrihabitans marinus]